MTELLYHNGEDMSNNGTENPVKEETFLTHSLRVIPAIASSLVEAGMEILSVYVSLVGTKVAEIHVYSKTIPNLQKWALTRVIHPEILPHGEDHTKVVYTVDGVKIFSVMTEQEQDKYYPF